MTQFCRDFPQVNLTANFLLYIHYTKRGIQYDHNAMVFCIRASGLLQKIIIPAKYGYMNMTFEQRKREGGEIASAVSTYKMT